MAVASRDATLGKSQQALCQPEIAAAASPERRRPKHL
jgi:hypothetical protein